MVKCISVNAGGWMVAYKAHGSFFGVAEVAVTCDGLKIQLGMRNLFMVPVKDS
jgi:hypothetical protein